MKEILVQGGLGFLILMIFSNFLTWNIVFYLGLIRVSLILCHAGSVFYRIFLSRKIDLLKRYGEDSYVFITGAANGIGKEYAHQFAQEGFNLILIDKDEEGLISTKNEISSLSPSGKIIEKVQDLTLLKTSDDFKKLIDKFSEFDISIGVNNAGFTDFHDLHEASSSNISDILHVNCTSLMIFSRLFFNVLSSRPSKGGIINMASTIGGAPAKIVPMYSPTKSFVRLFTESLGIEPSKVDFVAVSPGAITTNFTLNRKFIDTCSANRLVKNVLFSLSKAERMNGWWLHEIWDQAQTGLWHFHHELYTKVVEIFGDKFRYNKLFDTLRQKEVT